MRGDIRKQRLRMVGEIHINRRLWRKNAGEIFCRGPTVNILIDKKFEK